MANVELATAYVSLVPTMQGVQGKIAEALLPAGAEADKAGKASGGMFAGGFAGALSAAAVGVAAGAAAVGGAAVGLYKVGAVFDDVTDTIRVGTGASGDALTGLVDIAKQVGTSVPTDFATAGSTVADLNTRLGLSGDTLSTVAQQYIQAGNILGETVDINTTTAAFSAFGIEGANVEGAMDTLFRVSQSTGIGLNDLAAQVQTSAAPLQNLGFSFEDTAALAGTLDKAGLNTSQVMASMSKGLVTLAKDGEEPQAAFKRVTGELQGFVSEGNTAAALDLASQVFGTKGASQFVGALQSGKVNLDDLTGAAGLTQDTILGLGQETADAAESWQLIKSKALLALEPMGTAVFDLAGKGLGFLAANMDGIIAKVSAFATMVGSSVGPVFATIAPIVAQVFGTIGSVLGPLIPQFFALFSAVSPIQTIFQAIQPLLPQLLDVFTQLATVIGRTLGTALTALLPVFVQLQGVFVSVFQQILATALPVIVQLVSMLGATFAQLLPIIIPIVTTLAGLAVTLISQLMPIFMELVSSVLPMVVTIFGAVLQAIGPLISMIAGLLIPIIMALMPVVTTVFGVIASVIGSVMQVVMGIIQVVTGVISGNWSQVWAGIGNIFAGIWNTIVAVVGGAIGIVWSVISAGIGLVMGFIGGALGTIGRFFADTWNNIVNGVSSMIGSVVGFFGGLIGKITGAIGNAGSALFSVGVNIIQGLINGIGSMMGAIGRAVLNIVPEAIRGPFEQLLGIASPSKVFRGYGVNIGQGLILGIGDMHSGIERAVNGMVTVPSAPAYGSDGMATAAGIGGAGIYVQNPFTGEYLLAQVDGRVSDGMGQVASIAGGRSR